jgi:DNA (cytosine-5)-methyltransferase 1
MTKRKNDLTCLSFFSGCLGLDLGLEKTGIHQLLASEIDKSAVMTIKRNRPDLPVIGDLMDYQAPEIRKIAGLNPKESPTLIVGGPPCQAFSTAGKRQAFTDPRGNVFLKYVKLIDQLSPQYAVIENVRGLLSAALKHRPLSERGKGSEPFSEDELPGSALDYVIKQLKNYGYSVSFNLYNSANFGVPQTRERVILIASRDTDRVPYLTPTHSNEETYGLPAWRTFREAVKGLRENQMHGINFSPERLKYFEMLGPGQYWKNLPTEKIKQEAMRGSYFSGGGKTGFYRRLAWDLPAPTLVTHPAMPATELGHPIKNRPLTVEEYKRIQQFPDDWHIEGSIINQYKQIGNAVPIGLGEALGKTILNDLLGKKTSQKFKEFNYSRYKNTDDITWKAAFRETVRKTKYEQMQLDQQD